MCGTFHRHNYELKDLPGSARVTIFDGEKTALIYAPGGQIEHVLVQVRSLTEFAPDVHEAALHDPRVATPAAVEPTDFAEQLEAWLQQQAGDDSLEAEMMRGSLDSSPLTALLAALIVRARGE